jgi:ankyrin repeat protein
MADNGDDENPLVRALLQGRSLAVIRFLVEDTPHWLRHRDGRGMLPVHRIFEIYPLPSPKVVRYLLRHYPESVRERTNAGSLPLHLACAYTRFTYDSMSIWDPRNINPSGLDKIVRVLVKQWPDSIGERNADGQLPLHVACTGMTDEVDTAPLEATVRFLIEVAPESPKVKNPERRLALHCVLTAWDPSDDVVHCLVGAYPEALLVRDNDGLIPLHHHVAPCRTPTSYILKYLVDQCRESVKARDPKGRLPIHLIGEQAYLDSFQHLVDVWPESLQVQDDDGYVPLHNIVMNSWHAPDIVKYYLEIFPQAAQVKAKDGSFPLLSALQGNLSWLNRSYSYDDLEPIGGVPAPVRLLVETWPDALEEKSKGGMLPLQFAAVLDAPLDVLLYLATTYPQAVRGGDPSSANSNRRGPK